MRIFALKPDHFSYSDKEIKGGSKLLIPNAMEIKIPPYPNLIIRNENLKNSSIPTQKKDNSEGLSTQLIMMIPFNEHEHRVIRTRSISHKGNTYISALPNPVHLFLTLGVENFEYSEQIKETKFPKCGQAYGKDMFLLPIEENGTHQCYNDYIKYRSSSIIMLVSSLEAFINHAIPNDFIYRTSKKEYSKIEIESPKIIFRDKLEKVIPQYLQDEIFWDKHTAMKFTILGLYEIRKNLIHLKTNAANDLEAYFDSINEMLELDLGSCVDSLINFMNIVKLDFVEFTL